MVKKIVLAMAVAALGFALSVPPSSATMYLVTIPNVMNTPKAEAEKVLKAKGFQVAFVEGQAQMTTQIGKVIDQKPAAGGYFLTEKPKTMLVTLTIAVQGSFVPMVLLMKEADAAAAVKKAGFIPKVEFVPEDNAAMIGKVKSTVPAPHLKLAPGGTVTLQVGSAAHAMPNFVGSYAQGARQSIDQLNSVKPMGLKTTVVQGKTTAVAQDDQKIYEQSPAAGTMLKAGTEIRLTAYRYVAPPPPQKPPEPGKVVMPNLVGKSEKVAVETLQKAGLKVTVRYFSNPRLHAPGLVLGQSVAAGTQTAGPVELTVGRR
ncbi:MAG TPA: PASTA domain-containing protein [Syntrophales bacterium]|jgi:beta-lactam-binding protein with PASTA domain|nr:PASTA domain-containing protein [Syntrophales bacterium]HRT63088.1 PASTA domain-containing protein [Syntrophales bacterium]